MHAVTVGSARGEAVSRGRSVGLTEGTAETKGSASTRGQQEGLEPIMADLPSAIHSKENVLYMAAQTLRNLPTGTAFVNFVDASGMKAALLSVPEVRSYAPERDEFVRLRVRVLEASPSALSATDAHRIVARRKEALIAAAGRTSAAEGPLRVPVAERGPPADEPESPAGFRVKKARAPKPK